MKKRLKARLLSYKETEAGGNGRRIEVNPVLG
jgi:hypothetical protein